MQVRPMHRLQAVKFIYYFINRHLIFNTVLYVLSLVTYSLFLALVLFQLWLKGLWRHVHG